MCMYITTRHVYPNGSAKTESFEWVFCTQSKGRKPCPNQERREHIVQTESVGSPGSTISSSGPVTPISVDFDRRRRSTYDRPGALSDRGAAEGWSPVGRDEVVIDSRKPSKSPTRRRRRYRMSIDASLGPLLGPKPVISQPHPPSPTTDKMPAPARLRQTLPTRRPNEIDSEAGPSRRVPEDAERRRNDREEARKNLRRENRDWKRSEQEKRSSVVDSGVPKHSKGAPVIELTQTQEMKEREEQMWDAQELRTAQRIDYREQLREEARRKREQEEQQREVEPIAQVETPEITGDIEELEMTRRLAEIAVDLGVRRRRSLEEAHLEAERSVLEKKLVLSRMSQHNADQDAASSNFKEADDQDQERARLLRSQIREGRQREAQLANEQDQRPALDRLKDFAQGRRNRTRAGREERAEELRTRIRGYEQHLNELEARIRERNRAEQVRQQRIAELEQYIETLDRRIEARERRASMMRGAIEGSSMRERRGSNVASNWRWSSVAAQMNTLDNSAYLRTRGEQVLERDRQNAMNWEADEATGEVRLPKSSPRRRDTIGGQYRAREKAYRDPTRM